MRSTEMARRAPAPGESSRRRPLLALPVAAAIALSFACASTKTQAPPAPSVQPEQRASLEKIQRAVEALRPAGQPMPPVEPGDWLESYPEKRQTFNEYLQTNPTVARGERRIIYVQPLGEFSPAQRRIVDLTAEYFGISFGLPVKTLPARSLDSVPAEAQRLGISERQILASYIIDRMLAPDVPADAAVLVGLTDADLYPEPSWNYVFGVANLERRVGVWSMARFGDPGEGPGAFRQCLLRTLKIAAHETGHTFSLPHCVMYQCIMNGSNSLEETDRQPLATCPECTGKLCWATGVDAKSRLELIAGFCDRNGLRDEARAAREGLGMLDGSARRP